MLTLIRDFVNYWYFRYLLVTELYMVEKWERAMFHIIIFTLLAAAYVFNTTVMLGLVRLTINSVFTQDTSKEASYIGTISSNNHDM